MVIILDNNSVYINQQVVNTIQGAGHLIHFLLPYLPDFNPIKLTFLVLKSWIKYYYYFLQLAYLNFGKFLQAAIRYSNCNQFIRAQFYYLVNSCYIKQAELDWVHKQLTAFKRGELNIIKIKEPSDKGLNKG